MGPLGHGRTLSRYISIEHRIQRHQHWIGLHHLGYSPAGNMAPQDVLEEQDVSFNSLSGRYSVSLPVSCISAVDGSLKSPL